MRQLSLRGTDGARTHDLPHVKRTLIPAELRFHIMFPPKSYGSMTLCDSL